MGDLGNEYDELLGLADGAGASYPPATPEAATHGADGADPDPSTDRDGEPPEKAEDSGDAGDSAEGGDAMDPGEGGDPADSPGGEPSHPVDLAGSIHGPIDPLAEAEDGDPPAPEPLPAETGSDVDFPDMDDIPVSSETKAKAGPALAGHRARTLAALAADDAEIAAFAERNGIDPSDPHPGAEALLLVRSILEASSRVGEAMARGGDALSDRLEEGTEARRVLSEETAEAATRASEAADSLSRAADGIAEASSSASDALIAAGHDMGHAVERSSRASAEFAAKLVAGHAEKAVGDAVDRAIAGFDGSSEAAIKAATGGLGSLGAKASARLLSHVDSSIPKFEAAIARGIASAAAKKDAQNPNSLRIAAAAAACVLLAMALSWGFGRELGYRKGYAAAEATAIQAKQQAAPVSRGR